MPHKVLSDDEMIAVLRGEGDYHLARELRAVIQSDLKVKLTGRDVTSNDLENAFIESFISILPPDRF